MLPVPSNDSLLPVVQVHVCVDLTGEVGLVSFAVNDHWCGEAFRLPQLGTALWVFPHLLVKDIAVRVAFGTDGQLKQGPVGSLRPWKACVTHLNPLPEVYSAVLAPDGHWRQAPLPVL